MTPAPPVKTIGVLTGGGDVPGLNPCIKQLVVDAHQEGMRVLGVRRGWHGLVAFSSEDPDTQADHLLPLDPGRVRTIDRSGGTILHTSRVDVEAFYDSSRYRPRIARIEANPMFLY